VGRVSGGSCVFERSRFGDVSAAKKAVRGRGHTTERIIVVCQESSSALSGVIFSNDERVSHFSSCCCTWSGKSAPARTRQPTLRDERDGVYRRAPRVASATCQLYVKERECK
jgi:hypothetical protein